MTAVCFGAGGAATGTGAGATVRAGVGGGGGWYRGVACGGAGSSLRLFHTFGSPSDLNKGTLLHSMCQMLPGALTAIAGTKNTFAVVLTA